MIRIALAFAFISLGLYASYYWYTRIKPVSRKHNELNDLETRNEVIDVEERIRAKRRSLKEREAKLAEEDTTTA